MKTLDSADVELPYYSPKCESLKCELPSRGMTGSVFARKQLWSKGNFEFWPICWEWKLLPGKEGTRRWCKRACDHRSLFLQAYLAFICLKRIRVIWSDMTDLLFNTSCFPVCYLNLNIPTRKIKQLLSCQLSYLQYRHNPTLSGDFLYTHYWIFVLVQ